MSNSAKPEICSRSPSGSLVGLEKSYYAGNASALVIRV